MRDIRYKLTLFYILGLLLFSTTVFASNDAERLLSLIDYIGGDYPNAVSNGKIINQEEYDEMQEFSEQSFVIFKKLKSDSIESKYIEETLLSLKEKIQQKKESPEIKKFQRI